MQHIIYHNNSRLKNLKTNLQFGDLYIFQYLITSQTNQHLFVINAGRIVIPFNIFLY